MFHNYPYIYCHYTATSCCPPCTPHNWMNQSDQTTPMKMQEKPNDYVAVQVPPHYNYPNQAKACRINPKEYYSLT